MMARLTVVVVAVLLAGTGMAQAPVGVRAHEPSTLEVLNQNLADVGMQDATLREVIEFLRSYVPNANIEVRWSVLQEAGIDPEKPNITLKLKNERLSQVLRDIMQQVGGTDMVLAYRAVGRKIVISTQKDLGGEMISKVYDLRDLLAGTAHFQAPQMDPGQAMNQLSSGSGGGGGSSSGNLFGGNNRGGNQGGGGATIASDEGPEMRKILKIIKTTIAPDSWDDAGGKGTINPFNGVIVVYNSPLVHQQIAGFVEEEGLSQ
jgi:uncharacterized membrane protein YgcG